MRSSHYDFSRVLPSFTARFSLLTSLSLPLLQWQGNNRKSEVRKMLCLSRSGLRYYWLGDKKANVYGEEVTEANKRIGKAYSKARALMSLGMKRDDAWRKAVLSITGREVPTGFYMAD